MGQEWAIFQLKYTEWSHQTYPGNGRNCHTASACPNSRFIHIRVTFGGPTLYVCVYKAYWIIQKVVFT